MNTLAVLKPRHGDIQRYKGEGGRTKTGSHPPRGVAPNSERYPVLPLSHHVLSSAQFAVGGASPVNPAMAMSRKPIANHKGFKLRRVAPRLAITIRTLTSHSAKHEAVRLVLSQH